MKIVLETDSRRNYLLMIYPSLVWHTRPNNRYCHIFLIYYPLCFYFISLFYSTEKTANRDKPGGAAPKPNFRQCRKRKPLEVGAFQRPRGLRKNIGRRSYSSQYGAFPSFLFRPFASDKYATYIFPTDPPWHQLLAHGAATAAPPAPTPTQDLYWDVKHLGWPGS